MSRTNPVNLEASIRQRLTNHSVAMGEDFQLTLVRYGLERLMYRLSRSKHSAEFTVKGAMLFVLWAGSVYRPTRDLDLMTKAVLTVDRLEDIFKTLCELPVEADGLTFVSATVKAEEIREDDIYGGVRVTLLGRLGRIRIPIQVDVGFGDVVTPAPEVRPFPTLLDLPPPLLPMYSRESAVAEKFEAMIKLGMANSRMKDYYDIRALAKQFDFDGKVLVDAIRATFHRRETSIPKDVPIGLSDEFAGDKAKQTQWSAFVRRTRLESPSDDFGAVVDDIRAFLMPPTRAACQAETLGKTWSKGGPWQ
jgi:hypothetical protein